MNYDHLITPGKKYRFININPGFAGSFGHHGNMNLRIKEQVLKDGGDFLVLANQKLEVQFHQPYNAVPTFSEITGKLVYHGDDSDYYRNFRKEITDKINWIHQLDTDTVNIYFMYMGDVKYIPLLLDIAGEVDRRTNRFLLNLFYSYNDYFPDGEPAPGNGSESDLILEATEKAAEDRNLFFTTDADVLCSRVAENFQNKDNICLIPSFVSIFKDRETIPAPPGKKEDHRVVVCVPSTSEDRGYHQVGNLIRLLKQEGKLHLFRFVIRNQSPHLSYIKDTSQRLINDA
ncbi:MAG: hypothetical protein GY765_26940, partial [bacterium]|nr:hypothetical protein [bacterium]